MLGTLEINGKNLHPIKEAAQVVSYSRDYITRLARENRIVATNVGRQWFVDLDSLKQYIENSVLEQEVRKKQLSVERKQENQIRKDLEMQHTLYLKKAKSFQVKAVSVASLVLSLGLLSGFTAHQFIANSDSIRSQVANTHDTQLSQSPDTVAAVAAADDSRADSVENNNLFSLSTTHEFRGMGDVQNGILLLPNSSSTFSVDEMFSDKVVVRERNNGTQAVVLVDTTGNTIGSEIPFVIVPIEREEI